MAAQSTLTLNTVVHNPRGVANGIAKWTKTSDAGFGNSNITVTQSLVEDKTVTRIKSRLTFPLNATADTACGCAGTELSKGLIAIDVVFPNNFTTAQRTDAYLRLRDYVATAAFMNALENSEPVW